MSNETMDRFRRVDTTMIHGPKGIDAVRDESREASGGAREAVRAAITDVELRIDTLRSRTQEYHPVR